MVNLDDLDDVDWESLDHAYADEITANLRNSPDRIASYSINVAGDIRFTDAVDTLLVRIAR